MHQIEFSPIAHVQNSRSTPEDDNWSTISSVIVLAENISTEALDGIEAFSHLDIIYYFHLVKAEKAVARSRHPRNNPDWPKVGTYAQRNKSRPNRLGLTTVQLLKREGRKLTVAQLDAIDGTPILDIKPVMKEFLPKGEVVQPIWSTELMKGYW